MTIDRREPCDACAKAGSERGLDDRPRTSNFSHSICWNPCSIPELSTLVAGSPSLLAQSRERGVPMHVGMAAVFQNPGKTRADRDVYASELALADLAEPLGFQSIWGVEHHFTDYTMCPDVLQFLTYMAGRTSWAQLGSMVVVLPWHDPMRVAEEVSML